MRPEMLQPLARRLLADSETRGALATELARALARSRPMSWIDEEVLCDEGGSADELFVVMTGRIRVLRADSSGELRELVTLSAPVLIGHMGLVDGSPRSATCKAVGDVAGIALNQVQFQTLMNENSAEGTAFRRLILNQMMQQLTRANGRIRDMIHELEDERLNVHRSEAREWREKMRAELERSERPSEAERLRRISGVLNGWEPASKGRKS